MEVGDMLSVSSLLDFLMRLLRDEDAAVEFERDPEGMLARNGFDNVCGQDVRDAGSMLADDRSVSMRSHDGDGGAHYYGGKVHAVKEIEYLTKTYVVKEAPVYNNSFNDYITDYTYVDDRDVIGDDNNVNNGTIGASDGSAVSIGGDASGDQDVAVIEDSFNSDDDGVDVDGNGNTVAGEDLTQVAIVNSGNQDNDGVDNDGTIDDSVAAGDDIEDSFDTEIDIDDSFNDVDQTGLVNVNLDDILAL